MRLRNRGRFPTLMYIYWLASLLVHTSKALRYEHKDRAALSISNGYGNSSTGVSISPSSTNINFQTVTATPSMNSTIATGNPTIGTCCFMSARYVGVNTWYSKHVEVTVATVITTWLQYSNTLIPANSTTISINTTAPAPGRYTYGSSIAGLPTTIPGNLLPSSASSYGCTIIGEHGETAVTISQQSNLVIHSPTPFFSYQEIDLDTSWVCPTVKVQTQYTYYYQTWPGDGLTASTASTVLPVYTSMGYPSQGAPLYYPQHNAHLDQYVAEPFPDGNYANFSYDAWIADNGGLAKGSQNPNYLGLANLPDFLGEIPWVKSQFPNISDCTNLGGNGQPTVHIPVTQVMTTQHYTLTIAESSILAPQASTSLSAPIKTTFMATRTSSLVPAAEVTWPSKSTELAQSQSSSATSSQVDIGNIIASIIQVTHTDKSSTWTQTERAETASTPTDSNPVQSSGVKITKVISQNVETISSNGIADSTSTALEGSIAPSVLSGMSISSEIFTKGPTTISLNSVAASTLTAWYPVSSGANLAGEDANEGELSTELVVASLKTLSTDGTAFTTATAWTSLAVASVLQSITTIHGKATTKLLTEQISTLSVDGSAVSTVTSWEPESVSSASDESTGLTAVKGTNSETTNSEATPSSGFSTSSTSSTMRTQLPTLVTSNTIPNNQSYTRPATGTESSAGQSSSPAEGGALRYAPNAVSAIIIVMGIFVAI
ncbi:Hypothetical protein R9X50_00510000 [Acrodontium crateriforme]|uniref:Uncharacterized protein n=1 Tax=Acrodontium crateriforme TaxID=150365 RepID=A0AAQ3M6I1_9PEZI|nr:Hypothetical protein R9X50_00510000 [Acrodontium crateriforme]